MIRRSNEKHPRSSSIPRESGDDPNRVESHYTSSFVFPARAGMIPTATPPVLKSPRIPRESGDDPSVRAAATALVEYSPRERG